MHHRTLHLSTLAMLSCSLSACLEDYRVVAEGGTIKIQAESLSLDVSEEVEISVCGTDHNGFPVLQQTSLWLESTGGGGFLLPNSRGAKKKDKSPSIIRQVTEKLRGCLVSTFVAPDKPGSVTLKAYSGTVESNTITITVSDVPSAFSSWIIPTSLGPDGGSVTVHTYVMSTNGTSLGDTPVVVSGQLTSAKLGPIQLTNNEGHTSHEFDVAHYDTFQVSVNGLPDSVSHSVSLASPNISALAPQSCVWQPNSEITLYGTDFSSSAAITLDGVPVQILRQDSKEVVFGLPSAGGGPLQREVVVDNGDARTDTITFTYLEATDPPNDTLNCTIGGVQ